MVNGHQSNASGLELSVNFQALSV